MFFALITDIFVSKHQAQMSHLKTPRVLLTRKIKILNIYFIDEKNWSCLERLQEGNTLGC